MNRSDVDRQHMNAEFDALEDLALLADKLHLPAIQVQGVRNNLLSNRHTEVGGRIAALMFEQKTLRSIGMTFRPPV